MSSMTSFKINSIKCKFIVISFVIKSDALCFYIIRFHDSKFDQSSKLH